MYSKFTKFKEIFLRQDRKNTQVFPSSSEKNQKVNEAKRIHYKLNFNTLKYDINLKVGTCSKINEFSYSILITCIYISYINVGNIGKLFSTFMLFMLVYLRKCWMIYRNNSLTSD